jgi:surface carbohydrate biosynthesis protein
VSIADVRRRWVHLPVETKAREFESRLFLACCAAERGYGAVVGVKGKVTKMAGALPRGIFVEKSVQLHGLEGHLARRALGHTDCCLDEEGVVYIDAVDYTEGRLSPPVLDLLDRFFAWGDDQAAVVSKFHPPIADRIRVTGNPRVDLWRPELRALHEPKAAELRREHGNFVLVTTAFAMVNNSRGPRYFLDVLGSNGRMDTDHGRSWAEGYVAHSQFIFDHLREAVLAMARARPDRPIVLRPHPSEDLTAWQDLAGEASNVTVIREGSVTPWLLAAGAVVQNNSTTGLESVLIGRPTIAFVPCEDPRYDQNLPNAVSHPVRSSSELIEQLDAAFEPAGLPSTQARTDFIDYHIASRDGRLASERIVDEFDALDVSEARLADTPMRWARTQLSLAPRRLSQVVRRDAGVTKAAGESAGEAAAKFPSTSLDEVVDFVERVGCVVGRFAGVRCQELMHKVYAITCDGT